MFLLRTFLEGKQRQRLSEMLICLYTEHKRLLEIISSNGSTTCRNSNTHTTEKMELVNAESAFSDAKPPEMS